jgi:membrane protein
MTWTPAKNNAIYWAGLITRSFMQNDCLLRAAALAYTTILSLVPFLALAFALLKGFGVPNKLAPLILEKAAAGSQELVAKILLYINNTNMKSLGAIGLVTLLLTVISLLGEIEAAFNAIWGIKEPRPWHRKFSDYLSVVFSGPLLLFAATSITTSLQSQTVVQGLLQSSYFGPLVLTLFRCIPYLSIWMALIFLYLFLPNTRVRLSSAVIGGVVAGTVWQIAQWAYLHLQIYMASYNAIYGTMAMLPIFMIWLYTSWIIVLIGVEIVYAHQHRTLLAAGATHQLSAQEKTALGLALTCAVVRPFIAGAPPPSLLTLAAEARLSPLLTEELLTTLVSDVLRQLTDPGSHVNRRLPPEIAPLFAGIEQATVTHLHGFTLAQLAREGWSPAQPAGN